MLLSFRSKHTGNASLYSSYQELLEHAEDFCKGPHLGASKWERVNGKWGIDENTMDLQLGKDELGAEWVRYPIPFGTGDLVKLDAPMLEKPRFGVMDNVLDLNGTRYMWMGYVDGGRLDVMALSYNELDLSGYRVIDWLHSASPEELPEGEKILKELGEYLSRQPRHDFAVSDADDEFFYFFGHQNNLSFRRWTETPFSELLAQMRKESKSI